jgi:twitching motility two-component system response regulator PilG
MIENKEEASLRILIIDDSDTIRRSAERFLSHAGHQVVLAADGLDALSKIADADPDLIFCDILMPRLDGYQTCALVKKNARFHAVPFIMLSSKDGLFDHARAAVAGATALMAKPFSEEGLLQAVGAYAKTRGTVTES